VPPPPINWPTLPDYSDDSQSDAESEARRAYDERHKKPRGPFDDLMPDHDAERNAQRWYDERRKKRRGPLQNLLNDFYPPKAGKYTQEGTWTFSCGNSSGTLVGTSTVACGSSTFAYKNRLGKIHRTDFGSSYFEQGSWWVDLVDWAGDPANVWWGKTQGNATRFYSHAVTLPTGYQSPADPSPANAYMQPFADPVTEAQPDWQPWRDPTSPIDVPQFDPFNLPIQQPAGRPLPVPFWFLPMMPAYDPAPGLEHRQVGYRVAVGRIDLPVVAPTPATVVAVAATGSGRFRSTAVHAWAPPRPRERQMKVRASVMIARMITSVVANGITEGADLIDALWDALPDGLKTRKKGERTTLATKIAEVWSGVEDIDLPKALTKVVQNELVDRAIGTASQKAGEARRRADPGALTSSQAGPADTVARDLLNGKTPTDKWQSDLVRAFEAWARAHMEGHESIRKSRETRKYRD